MLKPFYVYKRKSRSKKKRNSAPGHRTLQLTDAYDHAGAEHLQDVGKEQGRTFG
jgi:hypothetical protein